MTNPSPSPTSAEPAPPDPSKDRGVCPRDVEVLAKLAEIGLELALIERQQAVDAEAARKAGGPGPTRDHNLAFSRIASAVRMTLALKAEFIADGAERLRKDMEDRAKRAEEARLQRQLIQKTRVHRAVKEVIDSEPRDPRTRDRLIYELNKRYQDFDAACDFRQMLTGDVIDRFCREMKLTPDWTKWWNETWAIEEGWIGPGHTIATGTGPPR